ncbi:MAG TPA: Wzz/FepE/Etk N-terminal domain-containing protein [Candidatus Binatia bacterium]|nr:Wzz/FepE/Etk N-terminal domain-containing protein [Candidatus Binatia bacterium]
MHKPRNGHGNSNGNRNGNAIGNGNGNGNTYRNNLTNGGVRTLTGNEQVREVLQILFKRQRLLLALFLVVALPGLLVTMLSRAKYIATAKVLITTERSNATVQPTDVTKVDPIQLNDSLVNSETHIIRSRQMQENVVRSLVYGDDHGSDVKTAALKTDNINLGQRVLDFDNDLLVTPIKGSNVIQIDYKSSNPEHASRVVNRVVDEYLAYHAQVHGNKGLAHFYEDQRLELEKQLRRAEDALKEYADREGVVSPKDEIQSMIVASGAIDKSLRDVNATLSGAEEKLRAVQQQLSDQPAVIKKQQTLNVNPVVTQLSRQLVDRQVDRVTLLRKYTERDRHVRDSEQEIAEIQSQLNEELRDRPTIVASQELVANPLRDDRLKTVLDLEADLKEQRAQRAALEEDAVRTGRRLIALRQKALEYDRLDQAVQNRRDAFELYVKREQEARIGEAMDQERLVNVDVVQRPALPLRRSDNQRLSVVLSLVSGLAVSLGGTFGLEYLNRALRSEHDVEQYLGLPVLGSIGDYSAV